LIDDAKSGADPKRKVFMYSAAPELDPFGIRAIKAANPALGDFLMAAEVRDAAKTAKRMPSRESSFRNLHLNQRISQTSPFIPRAVWEANHAEPEQEAFVAGPVYLGLDLSARNDLTALVAVSRGTGAQWSVRCEFFAPLHGVADRAHRDRAPYDVWAKAEVLTLTPGASVDYAFVAERVCSWCDDYDVAAVAFDRWRIDVLKAELARLGRELPLVEFGQGFKDMSPALDALESELLNGRVRHGGNPLLNWCAANAIAVKDPAMNRKLDKAKSTGRIDGLVALAMAIGAASKTEPSDLADAEIVVL
jgi:phage terminase large subunit-like protein